MQVDLSQLVVTLEFDSLLQTLGSEPVSSSSTGHAVCRPRSCPFRRPRGLACPSAALEVAWIGSSEGRHPPRLAGAAAGQLTAQGLQELSKEQEALEAPAQAFLKV